MKSQSMPYTWLHPIKIGKGASGSLQLGTGEPRRSKTGFYTRVEQERDVCHGLWELVFDYGLSLLVFPYVKSEIKFHTFI